MEVIPQELREYVTAAGKNPFHDWLTGLHDLTGRAMIRVRLNRLRLGNFGDSKSVGAGVHELRVDCGPGYRVYFGRAGKAIVILLVGGDKGSQARDISKAQQYWDDYQRTAS